MHKMNFSQSKKFGDRLEKTIALDFILGLTGVKFI